MKYLVITINDKDFRCADRSYFEAPNVAELLPQIALTYEEDNMDEYHDILTSMKNQLTEVDEMYSYIEGEYDVIMMYVI